jgi:hypothetical protein
MVLSPQHGRALAVGPGHHPYRCTVRKSTGPPYPFFPRSPQPCEGDPPPRLALRFTPPFRIIVVVVLALVPIFDTTDDFHEGLFPFVSVYKRLDGGLMVAVGGKTQDLDTWHREGGYAQCVLSQVVQH